MTAGNLTFARHILKSPAVLAAALLLCLNLSLSLWGMPGLAPETEPLEKEIARLQNALENRDNRGMIQGSKEKAYVDNEKVLKDFFAGIPDHTELPALIEELFTYARDLGLSIERINYQPKKLEERDMVRYGLNFQVEGNYDQIKHMIFLLENSPRIIALKKLQFQRRSSQSRKVVLGMDLETYFGPESPR
jgi:Tfp pilus assembly protein PilO